MKKQKKYRHSYLRQLILIFLVAICLPVILVQFFTVRQAYHQATEQSISQSEETSVRFSQYMGSLIQQTREHAYKIRTDRQITYDICSLPPYDRLAAIQSIENYTSMLPAVSCISMYFRNSDLVLTSRYSYTVNQYLNRLSGSDEFREQLRQLFSGEWPSDYLLISSFGQTSSSQASLFIVRSLKLGIDSKNNVLLLYEITAESLTNALGSQLNCDEYNLAILQDNAVFYSSLGFDNQLAENEDFLEFLGSDDSTRFSYSLNGVNQSVFRTYNHSLGLNFISVIPESVIMHGVNTSYQSMQMMIFLLCIVLAVSVTLAIRASYRPVSQLVRKTVGKPFVKNEFAAINNAIEEIQNQRDSILNQRMLLMDNIIGNLIYGFPVSQQASQQIADYFGDCDFFVAAAAEMRLNTAENDLLEETLHRLLSIEAFIIDSTFERHLVLICAKQPSVPAAEIADRAQNILSELLQKPVILGVGSVCAKIDDLRNSYLYALADLETKKGDCSVEKTDNTSFSTDVNRLLQCVQNGFENDALAQLDLIFQTHINSAASFPENCYLCRQLANAYIAKIGRMKLVSEPSSRPIILGLGSFTSSDALREKLESHIREICRIVSEQRSRSDEELKQRVLEYVDSHFTDSALSLMTVSDEFHISVYFCSRMFKEYVGIGFKEYIGEKRMRLAQKLLLSSKKSVAQISKDCGFENPTYFMTRFKTLYGVSPSKYRQSNASAEDNNDLRVTVENSSTQTISS